MDSRAHCEAVIGVITPIPCCRNLLFSVARGCGPQMSETYERISSDCDKIWLRERARILLGLEREMSDEAKACDAPHGSACARDVCTRMHTCALVLGTLGLSSVLSELL